MNRIYTHTLMIFLLFILFTNSSYAAPVLRLDADKTMSITFDNRFGQDSSYSGSKTFYIYNDGNTSMTISGVTISNPGSGITLSISSLNTVAAGSSGTVSVSVYVASSVSTGRYTGVINVNTLSAGSGTMNLIIDVTTKKPAELGSIGDRSTTIKFDKPKGTVDSFTDSIGISLRNIGDSILYIDSIKPYNPENGIQFSISDYSRSISPQSSVISNIIVTAPTSAREGTFSGKIVVTTSKERLYGTDTQNVDIRVTIEYGINMEISKSSIDFGDTELLKQKEDSIDIRETLGYKPINNLKLSKISGQNKWLSISPVSINTINAGGSDRIDVKLLYEGDAKPYEDHEWTYTFSTNNAGTKSLKVKSRMVFDVKPTLEKICSAKYNSEDNSREIAQKMCSALTFGNNNAGKSFKLDELILLNSIAISTIDLLDSYASAENSINSGNHDSAYENLMKGVLSAKMIDTYGGKVLDKNVKNDVIFVNTKSSSLMNDLMEKETNYYESNKNSESLQSMIAYERLSEMWGVLGNDEKQLRYNTLAKEKFEEHKKYVDSAKDGRLDAENLLKEMQNTYLSKWGGMYLLINPFYYSTVLRDSNSIALKYKKANQNYELAGEKAVADKTKERLDDIESSFTKLYSMFFAFTGFYTIVFLGVLSRTTKAMTAFVRDTSETRMGDDFL